MLPVLLDEQQPAQTQSNPTLLLLGDLNYDNAAGNLKPTAKQKPSLVAADEHRSAIRGEKAMVFPPLPGTAREIQQIADMYQSRFSSKPLELKQSDATPTRFCNEASKYRYLHLATHGFFSPPTVRSALTPAVDDQQQEVVGFNPGLLSGLALSGADRGARSEFSGNVGVRRFRRRHHHGPGSCRAGSAQRRLGDSVGLRNGTGSIDRW